VIGNFRNRNGLNAQSQALNADFEKFECNDLDNNGLDDIIAFLLQTPIFTIFLKMDLRLILSIIKLRHPV